MIRQLLFLLLLAVSLLLEGQEVCVLGTTILDSQQAVNDFGNQAGCDSIVIVGNLFVSTSDVTDLSPLEDLIEVQGQVSISGTSLASLNGLHNLKKISGELGRLSLSGNPLLTSLEGLSRLTTIGTPPFISIGGSLSISNCATFSSFSGIGPVAEIMVVGIGSCPLLTSMTGLEHVQNLDRLSLNSCENFSDFSGLGNEVDSIDISLSDCPAITSFIGFPSATTLLQLSIENCESLISFEGLESVEQVVQGVFVRQDVGNPLVFTGLGRLKRAGGAFLLFIDRPYSLTGLDSLRVVSSAFTIGGSGQLNNLEGLEALDSIGGQFTINNSTVEDISQLSGLRYVSNWNLIFQTAITDVVLPDSLHYEIISIRNSGSPKNIIAEGKYFGGSLRISDNDNTVDLAGMTGDLVSGALRIEFNDQLANCSPPMVCKAIADGLDVSIRSNGPSGCNSLTEVEAACALALPVTWRSFTASPVAKGVRLDWSIALEENNAYYAVEHSLDGLAFQPTQHLRPRPQNAEGIHEYDWLHETTLGGSHYYRIRQEDLDGSVSYSAIRQVTLAGEAAVRVYPTVVRDALTVELSLPQTTVRLLNASGQVVQSRTLAAGMHQLQLGSLVPGLYVLDDGVGGVHRVVRR